MEHIVFPVSMRGLIDILRMSKSIKHLISMIHKNKIFVTSAITAKDHADFKEFALMLNLQKKSRS